MNAEEIRGNIRYNEDLIDSYNQSIRQLEERIKQLYNLKAKFTTLQDNFVRRQSKRKNSMYKLLSTKLNVKMFEKYTTAMNQLITGAEYTNANNGLSVAIERICRQIRNVQGEIDSYVEKRKYRYGRLSYWQNQLQYADDNQ